MPTRIDPAQIPPAPNLDFESALWQQHIPLAAGLDEAGRGAWAGPVAAAAVILPADPGIEIKLKGVRDSKELTPVQREELAEKIRTHALSYATGLSSAGEIDALGILPATRLAMQRAISRLAEHPDHLLIDALFLPDVEIPQTSLIKGDQRSLSIAAASILAKTTRDALMREFDHEYPLYRFARHKGYGTAVHRAAIEKHGPCPIHRMSFAPLKEKSAG
jgi:ribonuclease HII